MDPSRVRTPGRHAGGPHDSPRGNTALARRPRSRGRAGPAGKAGRPAFIHFADYPTRSGYPFTSVQHAGHRYALVGRGFFSPQDADSGEVRALYDRWARNYDAHHPWTVSVGRDIARFVGASEAAPATLLDLCCGTGGTTLGLLRGLAERKIAVRRIVALDISREMVGRAREKLPADQVEFVVEDLLRYEPAGPFDVIVSSLAFDHIPPGEFGTTFQRIYASLDVRGTLAVVLSPARSSHREVKRAILRLAGGETLVRKRTYRGANGLYFKLEILLTSRGRGDDGGKRESEPL